MLRRSCAVFSLPLALAGCGFLQDGAVDQCEQYLLVKLKAPSTYDRADVSSFASPPGNPTRWIVIITYDAANSFNAPIRETQICSFPLRNGRPVTDEYIDFDAGADGLTDNAMQAASDALNEAENAR